MARKQTLAAKRPESGLMPKDDHGRLEVTRWQFWDLAHWDRACETFLFEYVATQFIVNSKEWGTRSGCGRAGHRFHRAAKVLDGQLRNRKFVTGDTLTVADFSLGAPLNYAEMAHLPVEAYAEIRRWYGALSAIPA
jgi:glutathione S-transferase